MATPGGSMAVEYFGPGQKFPAMTWAEIGELNATTYAGVVLYCTDAPGGASLILASGGQWRPFARDVRGAALVTNAAGEAPWTFSPAFAGVPIPRAMAANTTAGQPYIIETKTGSLSAAGVTFIVKRLKPVPTNIVTLLLGGVYDLFVPPSTVGANVTLYASASLPTQ